MFIPEGLRANSCVTAHSKELKLGFSEIFETGDEEPARFRKGAILYEDEYTTFYLFVNEFIFAGESMGYGYRLGGGRVG